MKKILKTATIFLTKHEKELIFWSTSAIVMFAVACTAFFLSSQVLSNYEAADDFHSSAPLIQKGVSAVEPTEEFVHFAATSQERTNDALGTVKAFFKAYNDKDFKTACRLLSAEKCNPESPYAIERLSEEYNKMTNGYENWNFWMAENTENFHSDVVCVKYSYHYKDDVKNKRIHERLSFYVRKDVNGNNRIYNRICEKKFAQDSGDMPCPILSKRDFCLD